MNFEITLSYDPELECQQLFHCRYSHGVQSPKMAVPTALERIAEEYGLPLEPLRTMAAPALELEEYIVDHMAHLEHRVRYFYLSDNWTGYDLGSCLFVLRKQGVRLRDLDLEDQRKICLRFIPGLSHLSPEEQEAIGDPVTLIRILSRQNCPDHEMRVCLEFYIDPAAVQQEYNGLLEEAARLYREKMDILPPVSRGTFDSGIQRLGARAAEGQLANISVPESQQATMYPSMFCFQILYILSDNSLLPSDPNYHLYIMAGVFDNQIDALLKKHDNLVPELAQELKVICEPRRLELLHALAGQARSVEELAEATGLSQNMISYHMGHLVREKLANLERRKVNNYYSINYPVFRSMIQTLCHYIGMPRSESEH